MRIFIAAVLAAGLATAPLPALAQTTTQPAASDTQTAAPEKKPAKAKRPLSPGQIAMHERLKKCAAEWKETEAAGKVEKRMTWPKFWHGCNKRLKTAG